MTGWRAFVLGLLLASCAGAEPPAWGGGALVVEQPGPNRIAFSWPRAVEVSAYLVHVDGRPAARLGPEERAYAVTGLREGSAHTIEVLAVDEAGNASAPLVARARTPDVSPPTFPEEAALQLRAMGSPDDPVRRVHVSWPEAVDAVRYRVLHRGVEVAVLEDALDHMFPNVVPNGAEVFEVRAVDVAGNETNPGLLRTWTEVPLDEVPGVRRPTRRSFGRSALAEALSGSPSALQDILLRQALTEPVVTDHGVSHSLPLGSAPVALHRMAPSRALAPLPAVTQVRARARLMEVRRIEGTREREPIQRVARARISSLRRCYERRLSAQDDLVGRVTATFDVMPTGTVEAVAIPEDETGDAGVVRCVTAAVRRMRFPFGESSRFALVYAFEPAP